MRHIFLFLLFFIVFTGSAYELSCRFDQANFLLLDTPPLNQADALLSEQRWHEAQYLAMVIKSQSNLGDSARAHSIHIAANTAIDSLALQSSSLLDGAISGEPYNGASLLGTLALDLFVVGDIRDLLVQGYKQITNSDGDKIILALSATGLSLALLPELHWAPAILKSLKRRDALSPVFINNLAQLSTKSLNSKDFKPLAELITDFAHATRHLGLGPTQGAIKAVETPADMRKFALAAAINPSQTYAISHLAGNRSLKLLSASGSNVGQVTQKLKRISRLAKISKKSFGIWPTSVFWMLLFSSLLIMSTLVWRFRRRNKPIL